VDTFGALLLGLNEKDKLTFVGQSGNRVHRQSLRELLAAFRPYEVAEQQNRSDRCTRRLHVAQAGIVAEVGYQNLTDDNRLRAPRFIRLRTDKTPATAHYHR